MSTTAEFSTARTDRPGYRWAVVGMLWFCGFFNYADRQAVFSIFPLLGEEFGLSNLHRGAIASAFMMVYALMSPFAGFVVDRYSRRWLVASGLAIWSLVCALTGTARSYAQLLFYRAAEGLGESFYFPASMSLVSDYHGPRTRSRAMSIHQTSVYVGTAAGGIIAGYLGQYYGWRSPFFILGVIGMGYALVLPWLLIEPERGAADSKPAALLDPELPLPPEKPSLVENLVEFATNPAAMMLLVVFAGANFVASTLLAWLPQFVKDQHHVDLLEAATVAGLYFPGGNLIGALCGGALADMAARKLRAGRVLVQASGLLLGAPCVYIAGTANSMGVLVPALIGIGLAKGIYDANIFASVFDVVRPALRGTTAGVMNLGGWVAGFAAPLMVGWFSDQHGLGAAIAWTAGVYVVAGVLALLAAIAVSRRTAKAV